MAGTNRRHFPRQNEKAFIQFLFTRDHIGGSEESEFIPVILYNQSEDGLYIEIDRALQPGSNVSFKMIAPKSNHPEDAYHMQDGRVIWCKKVDGETARFGVGVKVLRKVVQAKVLTSRFNRPV